MRKFTVLRCLKLSNSLCRVSQQWSFQLVARTASLFALLLVQLPTIGFAQQAIFPLQDKHVHSSSVIELPDGDLFACWYHGSGERTANDVVIQGARWNAKRNRWGPVLALADTPGLPDCNPILFLDAKQRVWLFWVVVHANRWEHSILKYRRADRVDPEKGPIWNWQDVIHLVPGEGFVHSMKQGFDELQFEEEMWAEYAKPYTQLLLDAAKDSAKRQCGWMPRVHPITLPSGRIVLPLYSDGFNLSMMALSDDQGETWQASKPIVGLGPIQPAVLHRRSGQLVAYFRDAGGAPNRILQSVSDDQGESWSVARDTQLPNPGSSVDAVQTQSGDWWLVVNDAERGRHNLRLKRSTDEGRTWQDAVEIENDASGKRGFSYPSMIEATDGSLHVTYSYSGPDGATIKHYRHEAAGRSR